MDENFRYKFDESFRYNISNNKKYMNNTYNTNRPILYKNMVKSNNQYKNTHELDYIKGGHNHKINIIPINNLYGHGKKISHIGTNKHIYNFSNNKIYSDIYTREINNTFNYITNQNKIKYGAANIENIIDNRTNISTSDRSILNGINTSTLNTSTLNTSTLNTSTLNASTLNASTLNASTLNTSTSNGTNRSTLNTSTSNGTNGSTSNGTNGSTSNGTNRSTLNGTNESTSNGTNGSTSNGTNRSASNGTNGSTSNGTNRSASNGTNESTSKGSTLNGSTKNGSTKNGNSGLGEVTDLGEGVLVGTQFSMEIDITDMEYLNRWTCGTGANVVDKEVNVPNEFDCRVKWGNRIMGPLDQGTCGSCWAFACTTAFSDRVRIFSTLGTHNINLSNTETRGNQYCLQNEENVTLKTNIPLLVEKIKYPMTPTEIYIGPNFLSPYYLASCETCDLAYRLGKEIGDFLVENRICGNCCAGNTLQIAHIFLVIGGIITMGNNPSGYTECQNGNIVKCDPNNDPNNLCKCFGPQFFTGIYASAERDSGGSEVIKNDIINEFTALYGTGKDNPNACFTATTFPLWKAQKVYRVNIYQNTQLVNLSELSQNTKEIQLEIMTNGPVTAAMLFYSNFATISQDVVFDENDAKGDSGGHSVVIMGWGVGRTLRGDIKDYWLIRNSYGTGLQNGGYFKIERGINFCRIEDDVWAAQPFQVYNPSLLYNNIEDIDTTSVINYIPPLCRENIPDSYTQAEKQRYAEISANFYNTNLQNVSRQVTNPNA